MAEITFDISAKGNQPPSQSGWLKLYLDYNTTHVFTLDNFTTQTLPEYIDPEGDPLEAIRIDTIPAQGVVSLSGTPISAGDIITSAQLNASVLAYASDASDTDGYSDSDMTFVVSDTGSSTFTTSPKEVLFIVAYDVVSDNQSPDTVGDGEKDIVVGETVTLTRAMLTTELNPPYNDPEGNPAGMLLVVTVPGYGNLILNGSIVVDGQEISFNDIDAGYLTYTNDGFPDGQIEGFEFKIADTVSGIYTG